MGIYGDLGGALSGAAKLINELPTADRTSVDKEYLTKLIQEAVYDGEACARLLNLVDSPQGEWIDCKGGWKCTACNKWSDGQYAFCPHCGAQIERSRR